MDVSPRRPNFRLFSGVVLLGLCLCGWSAAQDSGSAGERDADPVDIGKQEEVDVRMVLVDVVVLDRKDRTVADLTIDDFEVLVDGGLRPIDSLDLACEDGATEDVRAVSHAKKRRDSQPVSGRQIALVVDYLHLSHAQRAAVFSEAKRMVRHAAASEDAIMVAALIGGIRIEQPFTTDHERVYQALHRMEYDVSLWTPSYSHLSELPLYNGLTVLLNALETVPGSKAMVLFSNSLSGASKDDLQFARVAAAAATARCSIYPVYASGMQPP